MEINSGIYKITCSANNKIYIGSAVKLNKRKSSHFETLRKNKHKNKHLQSAYNKYGIKHFSFEILEFVEISKLLQCEQYWIDLTRCTDNKIGFNRCFIAGSCLGIKHSEKTRKKRSELNKGNKFGVGKIHNSETRKKMSLAHKGRTPWNKGIPHTEKTKRKISKSNIGRTSPTLGKKMSEETKKKMSDKRMGVKLSEQTKKRMSASKIGVKMSEETKKKISLSHTGELNPFYGKRHSDSTKEKWKNRKGMKGKKHSLLTKQKISNSKKKNVSIIL